MRKIQIIFSMLIPFLMMTSCGGNKEADSSNELSGSVKADGSSTVYPLTEAIAEEFTRAYPKVKVTVGLSGTGGGFKKFSRGETDINNASRQIKQEEIDQCKTNNIEYAEVEVCFDGLSIAVNPKNTWCNDITVAELKMLWEPAAQGSVTRWNQVRESWPDQEIRLYGAGTESGTYDYFTEAIVGKSHSSRGDYTASEDDNVLVQGVSSDVNALGFFGFAYYMENKDKLKIVGVDDENDDNGKGPVVPTIETVKNKTYSPLSRPLYIYVNSKAVGKPEVQSFIDFYISNSAALSEEVGYIPLTNEEYDVQKNKFSEFVKSHEK